MYKEKQQKESKIKDITYEQLELKEYLKHEMFSKQEKELLVEIRSKCYNAKSNFKKRHLNRTDCSFGCPETEDQKHIFLNCPKLNEPSEVKYEDIDGSVISSSRSIFQDRQEKETSLGGAPTWGGHCQDPC